MHKIIIVGHPLSGYRDVERLLNECGMSQARPSRRDNFLPTDISQVLCKAHSCAPLNNLSSDEQLQQIGSAPVWHGMALDLMLGNLEQSFWGWSDPNAIYLLDYWKQLDPSIKFVFVYNDPLSVLTRLDEGEDTADSALPEHRLNNWHAFNAAMLYFFNRNPERSLLVHADQVGLSVGTYLQQLRTRLDAPLADPPEQRFALDVARRSRRETDKDELIESHVALDTRDGGGDVVGRSGNLLLSSVAGNAVESFIADLLIEQHPEARQLYEELQSVSNLPLLARHGARHSVQDAWCALNEIRQRIAAQFSENRRNLQGLDELAEALARNESLNQEQATRILDLSRELAQNLLDHEVNVAQLQSQMQVLHETQADSRSENELLLAQLFQIQEELERHYHENQQYLQALAGKDALLNQRDIEIAEQAQQLNTRKNELAKLEQANQHAQTVRITLQREVEDKNNTLAEYSERLDTLTKQYEKTKSEAEAIAGQAEEVEQENELLLLQLKQIQEELERYYLENQQNIQALAAKEVLLTQRNEQIDLRAKNIATLKKEIQRLKTTMIPKPPPRYGAAARVKRQIGYRLGATMVEKSKTFGGWVGMPWALARTALEYRKEKLARGNENLPPISQYRDADEAERVKSHLNYRLGVTFIAHIKSPIGWVKLPFAIRREVKAYLQERRR
jgi:hypothetical protein